MTCRQMACGNPPRRFRAIAAGSIALAASLSVAPAQSAPADSPFTLERTLTIPAVPPGPYSDYLTLDPTGQRLFATPQAAKAVAVLDLGSGQVLKMITGIGNSHGIYYSGPLKRLFVADGASGDIKVYSGETYALLKTIPLARGPDWLTLDPRSKLTYVRNGGEDAGMDHSLISPVQPATFEQRSQLAHPSPH